MRQRSDLWIRLAARGRFRMESIAVIGGVTYTAISAPVINRSLASENLSVGNCISATMKVSVLTDDEIPKSAPVVIKARITDDVDYSEWMDFGTFYIDNRDVNSGLVTLQCYDTMLKASQKYVDETNDTDRIGWPKTMQDCVTEIAARIGVEIDSRTVIKTTDPYQVPYPAKLTMMQVLGYIGACHGGNWIITPENKLRLVPLVSPPNETFNIVDYDYNRIYTSDGYKLVWQHTETAETVDHRAGGGLINVPVVIGKITTSRTMTVSRVTLGYDDDLGYTVGDSTGYEIRIEENPYACQAICDDLYAELNGLIYSPFTIQNACYDPATELGDWMLVGDQVRSVLYSETVTLNVDFRSNASAPGKDEVSSEYPYLGAIKRLQQADKKLEKYMEEQKDEIHSRIDQTRTSILLEVAGTYATQEEVRTDIEILAGEIVAEVERSTAADEDFEGRLTINENAITAEVSRAKGEEEKLSSSISVAVGKIDLKVSVGDVSSQISVETGKVTIGANRLTIESDNFTLSGNGEVNAKGSITSAYKRTSSSPTYSVAIKEGDLRFYYEDSLNFEIANYDDDVSFRMLGNGVYFTRNTYYYSPYFILNNGFNWDNCDDRLWMDGGLHLNGTLHHNGTIRFSDSENLEKSGISNMTGDDGTYGVYVDGDLYASNDLWCGGTKYRVVKTDNYGSVGLSAVESAVAVFSDIGSGTVDDTGASYIYFDPVFAETIDLKHEYQVFVSSENTRSITHIEKEIDHFIIYGEPGSEFDWILFARQKNYTSNRLEPANVQVDDCGSLDSSIFDTDDAGASQSMSHMNEFVDTYDEQAEAYLNQYEQEVTNYGY